MDFLQVYDIKIPEGTVKYLDSGSTRLWQKPDNQSFEFPGITLVMRNPSTEQAVIPFIINRENMTAAITNYASTFVNPHNTILKASFCMNYINNNEADIVGWKDQIPLYIDVRKINKKEGLSAFPAIPGINISDAEWTLSDIDTGKIHLFAYPSNSLLGIDEGVINTYNKFIGYPTYNTEVTVDAGDPLINFNSGTSAIKITSIRKNFDDYNEKYDIATAGKYSRTQYPYLGGYIEIKVKSSSEGIHNWGGWRIYFLIGR